MERRSQSRKSSYRQTSEIKPEKSISSILPLVKRIKKTSRNSKNQILITTGDKKGVSSNFLEEEVVLKFEKECDVEEKNVKIGRKSKLKSKSVDTVDNVGVTDEVIINNEDKNGNSDQLVVNSDGKVIDSNSPVFVCESTIPMINIEQNTDVENKKDTGSDSHLIYDSDASTVDFNVLMRIGNLADESTLENMDLPKRKAKRKSCGRLRGIDGTNNVEISSSVHINSDINSDIVSALDVEQVESDSIKNKDDNATDTTTVNSNVGVELSSVNIVDIDRSKYENLGFNKFACNNPLMQTLFELRKSFPFKDHVKVNVSNEKQNAHCAKDILSLDSMVSLANNTPTQKNDLFNLSSQLQTPVQPDLYFDMSKSDKIDMDKNVEKLMKKSVLLDDLEKMEKAPKLFVTKNSIKLESERKRDETAGKGWYNLPKTEVTDKIKNDLQLIKMRNVLDSKHHYKRNDSNKLPKYFQMGTIVEGAHEFYSARVVKNKRKRTMVDELLDDVEFRRKNKQKYIEIRKKQMSGGKGFYKKLKNKSKQTWERT